MGSNFIWSEGAGEGREDNDRVSNQVGGLIIPGSAFIRSLLQLGNFPVLSSCVFNSITGLHSLTSTVGCLSVLSTQLLKPSGTLLCSLPTQPCPIQLTFHSRRGCFLPSLLLPFPLKPLSAFTLLALGQSLPSL